jgi:hypothetical protein
MTYQVHGILKSAYSTTQSTIIEILSWMIQKEEIQNISNKKQSNDKLNNFDRR